MKLEGFLRALGAPAQSAEEETFELFAQDLPSQSLGFVDPKAPALDLTIGGRDLTIHQSPAVLSSNRAGGTTGAVVWKITPSFAEWISSPSANNPFFAHGILSSDSVVLELGCGVSGLVGVLLGPRISRYVLTDQPYVAKLVEQNVAENQGSASASASISAKTTRPPKSTTALGKQRATTPNAAAPRRGGEPGVGRVRFTPLDWETDEVTPDLLTRAGETAKKSFDAVLACDCIYNEALIEPFISTCVDICRLRTAASDEGEPCICVVAQQLRDHLVFEAWMSRFAESFHVWRVPDELLLEGLRSNSGFVVHVGVLREVISVEGR
ncbi:Ribosomal lysine N-methyltransferase 5 [Madurella mycetomatis]|uniref:Ribosomal lysine N-methyltransferase 5 n=1 Tax=Madurella mycetomatis TaxID=100816 RepID=A0A175W6H9_9PEZI|nr:Ribosomal lysine N-methyltransferase 5 [Madurella mycetomatis]